jgi:hypothetical protein
MAALASKWGDTMNPEEEVTTNTRKLEATMVKLRSRDLVGRGVAAPLCRIVSRQPSLLVDLRIVRSRGSRRLGAQAGGAPGHQGLEWTLTRSAEYHSFEHTLHVCRALNKTQVKDIVVEHHAAYFSIKDDVSNVHCRMLMNSKHEIGWQEYC